MVNIGNTIRIMRKKQDMNIKELAAKTGMTSSHISQVERGLASPSLSALENIAIAFGVPITLLLTETLSQSPVVKKAQRESTIIDGTIAESLTGGNALPFGVYITNSLAEHKSQHKQFCHQGTEFLYVQKGSLKFHIGQDEFLLEQGDSICYDASRAHWGHKVSDELQTIIVTSITPPTPSN